MKGVVTCPATLGTAAPVALAALPNFPILSWVNIRLSAAQHWALPPEKGGTEGLRNQLGDGEIRRPEDFSTDCSFSLELLFTSSESWLL